MTTTVVKSFGVRLRAAVAVRGPLCVGIDPHAALLADWGRSHPGHGDTVSGLERFSLTVVEALADRVAIVKPQSAFFERFGSRGVAVLERVLAACRDAGVLTLLDVKRGDIGSTAAAYAAAYLDPASPLAADAITASPYLGFGSLQPMLDAARAAGAGVFVLALTSNPEGSEVQRAIGADGRTVAARVFAGVRAANTAEAGAAASDLPDTLAGAPTDILAGARAVAEVGGWGSTGVVVGATVRDPGPELIGIGGPVLAPGVGAQGATMADLPRVFGVALPYVLPAVSRDVLRHGPDPAALRAAVARLQDEAATSNDYR